MNKNIYDYIIYGAGVPAISLALKFSRNGAKVLLLNKYGFCGGRITENLELAVNFKPQSDSISKEIFDSVIKLKDCNISLEKSITILDPENIRYAFLKILKENKIDFLFNVMPYQIKLDKSNVIKLLGRDKEYIFSTPNLIDASSSLSLVKINNPDLIKNERIYYNILVSKNTSDYNINSKELAKKYPITKNREYVKLLFTAGKEFQTQLHKSLYLLNEELLENSCRIQLLPIEPMAVYNSLNLKLNGINVVYSSSKMMNFDDFVIAEMVERTLIND